jgi:hypothetical protein
MKKQLHIKPIVSLLFLFVVSISLQAQQFEWAKSYSGQDDPLNSSGLYNRIFNSVFDSQGNIYISGTFGTGALIDTTHVLNDMYYPTSGVFLAKLNPEGELIWHIPIAKHSQNSEYPTWMEMVGDTSIAIMSTMYVSGQSIDYFWHVDTLIRGDLTVQYPMVPGSYSSFLTFDLDGNMTSQNFLNLKQIKSDGTIKTRDPISMSNSSPFHIDKNGNIYIYFIASKYSNSDTLQIEINRQKTFTCGDFILDVNSWILKLTPVFDLVWAKNIIRDTSGVGTDPATNSFTPYITGISADSEDNMYLTGYLNRYRGVSEDTTFYKHIELGNDRRLIINDAGCANLGFIIKYDTTGKPQWANQLYGKKNFSSTEVFPYYTSTVYNSTVNEDNNSVYIIGSAVYDTTYCKLYFDDSTQYYSQNNNPYAGGAFFARFNKETGKYLSHGLSISTRGTGFYATNLTYNVSIAAKNNQVFSQVRYFNDLVGVDTVFTTGGMTSPSIGLMRWKDDGEVIDVINIPTNGSSSYTQACNTILNDNGDLFITGMFDNTISFGDITLIGSSGRSNAFMAKYHDSTFVHTYVGDTSSLLREISLEGKGIIVYPNPTKGDVNITTQGEKINSFSLYNVNGQLLLKSEKLKTKMEKLNLSNFSKGVYMIKIITDKNVYSKKVIVN